MIADSDGISLSTDSLILFMLVLFSVDFLDYSGILIAMAISAFLFLHFTELQFDVDVGILFLFSAFYFGSVAFYEGTTVDVIIKFALAPWGCYILGYNMRLRNRSISVTDYATFFTFGFFLHGMLNLFAGIQVYGASLNSNFRLSYDFWQQRTISVTTASLYHSPFALMSIGILFFTTRRGMRLVAIVSFSLAIYASMVYQNRTLFLVIALVFSFDLLLLTRDEYIPAARKRLVFGALIFFALCAVVAFLGNVAGIRDTIMNSSLMNRMSGEKQDRTTIWFSFLFGEAWKYPFGGTQAVLYDNKPFVHNMWLDTFRRTGVFPFLLLILFTLRSVFNVAAFVRLSRLTGEDGYVIVSLFSGLALSFMVEPVIESNPYAFFLPLLVMGLVNGHNRDVKELLGEYD